MAFTATARIPTRPLSYSNSSMATNKELLVDWENHKIYISDSSGNVVEVSGSGSSSGSSVSIDYSTNTLLTCSTAAATAAKTISLEDYELKDGNVIYIKFTNDNTATSPTLNINSTGAKAINYRGSAVDSSYIKSKKIYQMFYTNGVYEIVGDLAEAAKDNTPTATTTTPGLLAPTDKEKIDKITDSSILSDADRTKIDSIPTGGLTIDNAISSTSENPVQNKAIKAELDKYLPLSGGTVTGSLTVKGKIIATANSDYTTYQVRNMALSTSAATPTGNGSLLGVYS